MFVGWWVSIEEATHTPSVGKGGLTAAACSFNESVCAGEWVSLKPYWRATPFHPSSPLNTHTHTHCGKLTNSVTSLSSHFLESLSSVLI